MDNGKIRYAHKEHLIESDAEIVDRANPERTDIPHEPGNHLIQDIKVTQNAIHDLHDKRAVTPVEGLSELVKRMLRFTLSVKNIGKACNRRNPRFCHAIAGRDFAATKGSPVKRQEMSKRFCAKILIIYNMSHGIAMKFLT